MPNLRSFRNGRKKTSFDYWCFKDLLKYHHSQAYCKVQSFWNSLCRHFIVFPIHVLISALSLVPSELCHIISTSRLSDIALELNNLISNIPFYQTDFNLYISSFRTIFTHEMYQQQTNLLMWPPNLKLKFQHNAYAHS